MKKAKLPPAYRAVIDSDPDFYRDKLTLVRTCKPSAARAAAADELLMGFVAAQREGRTVDPAIMEYLADAIEGHAQGFPWDRAFCLNLPASRPRGPTRSPIPAVALLNLLHKRDSMGKEEAKEVVAKRLPIVKRTLEEAAKEWGVLESFAVPELEELLRAMGVPH